MGGRCLKTRDTHPLQVSVATGDAAMVRLLVQFGADPNLLVPVGGRPILFLAILAGHEDVVQALLDVGAESHGDALIAAARCSQLPVVKVLLQHRGSQPSRNTVAAAIYALLRGRQQDADSLRIFAALLLHLCCHSPPAEAVVVVLGHPDIANWQARSVLTGALLSSWGEMDAAGSTLASQEQHLAAVRTAAQHLGLQADLYLRATAAQATTSSETTGSDTQHAATAAAALAGAAVP